MTIFAAFASLTIVFFSFFFLFSKNRDSDIEDVYVFDEVLMLEEVYE